MLIDIHLTSFYFLTLFFFLLKLMCLKDVRTHKVKIDYATLDNLQAHGGLSHQPLLCLVGIFVTSNSVVIVICGSLKRSQTAVQLRAQIKSSARCKVPPPSFIFCPSQSLLTALFNPTFPCCCLSVHCIAYLAHGCDVFPSCHIAV